jgi:hypothetical protein
VIEVNYQQGTRTKTSSALDMPEPTGITVVPDMSYHIVGTNQAAPSGPPPASWMDSFQDRDVYEVTASSTTNEMAVRLNWPGNTAGFDLFVFEQDGIVEKATGWYAGKVEDEFTTFAVNPGAKYWIWAGADDASTGQPINYDLTVCGAKFTPQ